MGLLGHYIGLLLIALICIKNSAGLSCYDCNSAHDKRCLGDANNKLTDDLKKPCPERKDKEKPYTLCRKIKQAVDFSVNGLQPDTRVIRTCGYDDSSYVNRCYQRSGFGGRQEVCTCQADDCNGSTTIMASISLVITLMLLKLHL
ncbi:uncharacterized protein [Leptinotarsa decemlineata]|uniref:uncharacterized protein n=1 Tax=Leptinotarsa decemlineata TaxID=7539 RepID=UPI003D309669